eukprot:5723146-Pyramimonas_sp.AAC.1
MKETREKEKKRERGGGVKREDRWTRNDGKGHVTRVVKGRKHEEVEECRSEGCMHHEWVESAEEVVDERMRGARSPPNDSQIPAQELRKRAPNTALRWPPACHQDYQSGLTSDQRSSPNTHYNMNMHQQKSQTLYLFRPFVAPLSPCIIPLSSFRDCSKRTAFRSALLKVTM